MNINTTRTTHRQDDDDENDTGVGGIYDSLHGNLISTLSS